MRIELWHLFSLHSSLNVMQLDVLLGHFPTCACRVVSF